MSKITRVGVDLAKPPIQVHAVGALSKVGDQPPIEPREIHSMVCRTARGLPGRHGGLLQLTPLESQTAGYG